MNKEVLLNKCIENINMCIHNEKDSIIRVGSYFMKDYLQKKRPLYDLTQTEDGILTLETVGVISDASSIQDFLNMYTGKRSPLYVCKDKKLSFERYEETVGVFFIWYIGNLYSDIINRMYPDINAKIQFCKRMEWDIDSPNPEYVSDLLELYALTDACMIVQNPFTVFPEYRQYTIKEFLSLSDKYRKSIDKVLERGFPSYEQIRMIVNNI